MAKVGEVILLKSPDKLSSLNDIWGNTICVGLSFSNFNLLSYNSNNFRYWFEMAIQTCDDDNLNIGVFSTIPRPLDQSGLPMGYGAFSCASPLRSFLFSSPTGDPGNEVYAITQPISSYNLAYPFFLNPVLRWNIFGSYAYNPNLDVEAIIVNYSGDDYLGFSMSSVNPFSELGNIYVSSNNSAISGSHIVSANGLATYSFATTTLFTQSMAEGTNQAKIFNYLAPPDYLLTERYGFDGTQEYKDYNINYSYLIVDGTQNNAPDGGNKNFLSNYPNRREGTQSISECSTNKYNCFKLSKRVREDTYGSLSFIVDGGTTTQDVYARYKYYDSTYNLISSENKSFSGLPLCPETGKLFRIDIPLGTINLGITSSNVAYYSVQLVEKIIEEQVVYLALSELRYFFIDRQCTIYDPVQVMFKNKLGAWEYYTFTQDKKKRHSISRNTFKQELNWGEITNGNIRGQRGMRVISERIEEEYTLNSNWITEIEFEWLSELIESTDVYILEKWIPDAEQTYYPVPIMITDTSYEYKTAIRDKIFNLTINYKLANLKPSQSL
jgi:hypothetical protein